MRTRTMTEAEKKQSTAKMLRDIGATKRITIMGKGGKITYKDVPTGKPQLLGEDGSSWDGGHGVYSGGGYSFRKAADAQRAAEQAKRLAAEMAAKRAAEAKRLAAEMAAKREAARLASIKATKQAAAEKKTKFSGKEKDIIGRAGDMFGHGVAAVRGGLEDLYERVSPPKEYTYEVTYTMPYGRPSTVIIEDTKPEAKSIFNISQPYVNFGGGSSDKSVSSITPTITPTREVSGKDVWPDEMFMEKKLIKSVDAFHIPSKGIKDTSTFPMDIRRSDSPTWYAMGKMGAGVVSIGTVPFTVADVATGKTSVEEIGKGMYEEATTNPLGFFWETAGAAAAGGLVTDVIPAKYSPIKHIKIGTKKLVAKTPPSIMRFTPKKLWPSVPAKKYMKLPQKAEVGWSIYKTTIKKVKKFKKFKVIKDHPGFPETPIRFTYKPIYDIISKKKWVKRAVRKKPIMRVEYPRLKIGTSQTYFKGQLGVMHETVRPFMYKYIQPSMSKFYTMADIKQFIKGKGTKITKISRKSHVLDVFDGKSSTGFYQELKGGKWKTFKTSVVKDGKPVWRTFGEGGKHLEHKMVSVVKTPTRKVWVPKIDLYEGRLWKGFSSYDIKGLFTDKAGTFKINILEDLTPHKLKSMTTGKTGVLSKKILSKADQAASWKRWQKHLRESYKPEKVYKSSTTPQTELIKTIPEVKQVPSSFAPFEEFKIISKSVQRSAPEPTFKPVAVKLSFAEQEYSDTTYPRGFGATYPPTTDMWSSVANVLDVKKKGKLKRDIEFKPIFIGSKKAKTKDKHIFEKPTFRLPITKPITRPITKPITRPILRPITRPILRPKLITELLPEPDLFEEFDEIMPPFDLKKSRSPTKKKKRKPSRKKKRKLGYGVSLVASQFGIYGKQPKGILTGFEIRPMVVKQPRKKKLPQFRSVL